MPSEGSAAVTTTTRAGWAFNGFLWWRFFERLANGFALAGSILSPVKRSFGAEVGVVDSAGNGGRVAMGSDAKSTSTTCGRVGSGASSALEGAASARKVAPKRTANARACIDAFIRASPGKRRAQPDLGAT